MDRPAYNQPIKGWTEVPTINLLGSIQPKLLYMVNVALTFYLKFIFKSYHLFYFSSMCKSNHLLL